MLSRISPGANLTRLNGTARPHLHESVAQVQTQSMLRLCCRSRLEVRLNKDIEGDLHRASFLASTGGE
jgi:hypothetical protein